MIDDEESLRTAMAAALRGRGYTIFTAANGAEGLALADTFRPDVIVCDVRMPGIDGRSVLQSVRDDPSLADRQVVLMTAHADTTPQHVGMNLGADDYLTKPFTLAELHACLQARLRRAAINRRVSERSLQRLQETVTTTLPHELMTPLAGIMGLAELLRDDLGRGSLAELRDMVEDINRCAVRLHKTIRNYLLVVGGLAGGGLVPLHAESGALAGDLIRRVATDVAGRHQREADLQLALETAEVGVGREELAILVEELVDNAFVYSLPTAPVRVDFTVEPGGGARLSVQDCGRGFTAGQIEEIGAFVRFERIKYEKQGLGLGLTVVKHILASLGTDLSIESAPDRGSILSVRLPPVRPVSH